MGKKKTEITIRSSAAEYLTFVASTGDRAESIEMRYEDGNIWLTQKMMAELYNVDVRTVNYHIGKVFEDSELEKEATIRKFRIVQSEGQRQISREVNHYSLQMIIAVGFKRNSWKKSGRSGCLSGSFIRKSQISTPQPLTMTGRQKRPKNFLPRSRTRCILQSTGTPPPN